jgi:F-type H+-transporting ATPase subunit epsilon
MRLSLTTPRGSLVDAEADEVVAPGVLGELGVLPGHIPLVSALRPGVLVLRTKQEERVFAVGDGLLQVARTPQGDVVTVLVDQATFAAEVDKATVAKELADMDREIADWKREVGGEYQTLLARREWAAARADAAARIARH